MRAKTFSFWLKAIKCKYFYWKQLQSIYLLLCRCCSTVKKMGREPKKHVEDKFPKMLLLLKKLCFGLLSFVILQYWNNQYTMAFWMVNTIFVTITYIQCLISSYFQHNQIKHIKSSWLTWRFSSLWMKRVCSLETGPKRYFIYYWLYILPMILIKDNQCSKVNIINSCELVLEWKIIIKSLHYKVQLFKSHNIYFNFPFWKCWIFQVIVYSH